MSRFIDTFTFWSSFMESLSVLEKQLLSSVDATELNFSSYFGDIDKSSIEEVFNNSEFNKRLSLGGYRKSTIINSEDYETFLIEPLKIIKIFRKDSTNLEDPIMIIIQIFNSNKNKWEECELYKIRKPFKNFYDSMTTNTISIQSDKDTYVYRTSSVNVWELTDASKETETFPRTIRREELLKLIKSMAKNIKIKL